MAAVTYDNPELNFPDEWSDRKYDAFKRIIERMSTRMGGPGSDSINSLTEGASGTADSITLLTLKVANLELLVDTSIPPRPQKADRSKYAIWGVL